MDEVKLLGKENFFGDWKPIWPEGIPIVKRQVETVGEEFHVCVREDIQRREIDAETL